MSFFVGTSQKRQATNVMQTCISMHLHDKQVSHNRQAVYTNRLQMHANVSHRKQKVHMTATACEGQPQTVFMCMCVSHRNAIIIHSYSHVWRPARKGNQHIQRQSDGSRTSDGCPFVPNRV